MTLSPGVKKRARGRRTVSTRHDAVEVVRRRDREAHDRGPPGDAIEDDQVDEIGRDDKAKAVIMLAGVISAVGP